MKNNFYKLLFIALLFSGIACQRDDICPETTDTTPLLIIRFYENEEPNDLQSPQNLSIRAIDSDSINFVINTGGNSPVRYFRFSGDSIAIPLKTNADQTSYVFTLNTAANDTTASNSGIRDTLSFTYARSEEYINRACAYKVNYIGLKTSLRNSGEESGWIQDVEIEQTDIEDENQAHVSIFF